MNWRAEVVPVDTSWLRIISGASGTDEGEIIIGYDAYSGSVRTGTITITAPGAIDSVQEVTVYQGEINISDFTGTWEKLWDNGGNNEIVGWGINVNDDYEVALGENNSLRRPAILAIDQSVTHAALKVYDETTNRMITEWWNYGTQYIGSEAEHWNMQIGDRYVPFYNGKLLAIRLADNPSWAMLLIRDENIEGGYRHLWNNKGQDWIGNTIVDNGWRIKANDLFCTGRFSEKEMQLLCWGSERKCAMLLSLIDDGNGGFERKWYNDEGEVGGWDIGPDIYWQTSDFDKDGYDEIMLVGKDGNVTQNNVVRIYKFDLIKNDWVCIYGNASTGYIGEWKMNPGDHYGVTNFVDFGGESEIGELADILPDEELFLANPWTGKAMLMTFINGEWLKIWENSTTGKFIDNIGMSTEDRYRALSIAKESEQNGLLTIEQTNDNYDWARFYRFNIPLLLVSPKQQYIPAYNEDNELYFYVNNNCPSDWTAEPKETWIKIVEQRYGTIQDTLVVKCDINLSEERSGIIEFSAPGMQNKTTPIVEIIQQSPEFPVANIPADYGSINEAIRAIKEKGGGIVAVAEGTYNEDVELLDGIWVVGTGKVEATIINGSGEKNTINITGVHSGGIIGFTIQNSGQKANFAGIKLTGGNHSSIIARNIIKHNNIGIRLEGSVPPLICNNTIVENIDDGISAGGNSPTVLMSNIITLNDGKGISANGKAINLITHNDVYDNKKGDYKNVTAGTGDISMNPKFSNGYHLSENSPCKNSGITLDGSSTDMGAYGGEYEKWLGMIFDYIMTDGSEPFVSEVAKTRISFENNIPTASELITISIIREVGEWNHEKTNIGKTWKIYSTNYIPGNKTITFYYNDGEMSILKENSLNIYYFNALSETWEEIHSVSRDMNNNSITINTNTISGNWTIGGTGIDDEDNIIPEKYVLFNNYPNPFNPTTTIKYGIPVHSKVTLKIYDILGREIKTLVDEIKDAGYHSVLWDGRNDNGRTVSTGVYIYRIQTNNFTNSKKMLFLK